MAMFSVVGICFANSGTSLLRWRWSKSVQHFAIENFFQLLQIENEAGFRIDLALLRSLQGCSCARGH